MSAQVKGVPSYCSAAVILQCVTVLVTAKATAAPQPTDKGYVSDIGRVTQEDLQFLTAAMRVAHESARDLIDTFSDLTEDDDATATRKTRDSPVTNNSAESPQSKANIINIGASKGEKDLNPANNTELESSLSNNKSNNASSNITVDYSIMSNLVTSEGNFFTVDLLGDNRESEPSLGTIDSPNVATNINKGSSVESDPGPTSSSTGPPVKSDPGPRSSSTNLADNNTTTTTSTDSLLQDVSASRSNNTNNGTSTSEHDITTTGSLSMNISTMTLNEAVTNRTNVESKERASPLHKFIDALTNVFRINPIYGLSLNTNQDISMGNYGQAPTLQISVVNISSPKVSELQDTPSTPIRSVFDLLSRVSVISPIMELSEDNMIPQPGQYYSR